MEDWMISEKAFPVAFSRARPRRLKPMFEYVDRSLGEKTGGRPLAIWMISGGIFNTCFGVKRDYTLKYGNGNGFRGEGKYLMVYMLLPWGHSCMAIADCRWRPRGGIQQLTDLGEYSGSLPDHKSPLEWKRPSVNVG